MPLEVVLIDYARDPLNKLYGAYRTCYTPKTPAEVWKEIGDGTIGQDKIREFILERLKTGHASPLEQVVFWFGISGVSRALSHQFVRHRIGISFEQQSQRYVKYREDRLDYVTPKTWEKTPGMAEEYEKLRRASNRDVHDDSKDTTLPIAREICGTYVRNAAKLPWYIDLLNVTLGNHDLGEARRRIELLRKTFEESGRRITENVDFDQPVATQS